MRNLYVGVNTFTLQSTRSLIRSVQYQEHRSVSSVSFLVDNVLEAGSELVSGTASVALPVAKDKFSPRKELKLVLVRRVLRLSVAYSNFGRPNGSRYLYL
jgi:hypothetical protein